VPRIDNPAREFDAVPRRLDVRARERLRRQRRIALGLRLHAMPRRPRLITHCVGRGFTSLPALRAGLLAF
jgi:hypothetical protein